MQADIIKSADFTGIRYAQCWEDADVLLAGLDIRPGDVCLSIASAGDNVMAMLSQNPGRIVALDLSPAQIACLELRVAAYRALDHAGLLELIGSRPSGRRDELYWRCRSHLSSDSRCFWDARPGDIAMGIGSAGKFERYLALFRRRVLPLIHSNRLVGEYLEAGEEEVRASFYDNKWDCWRWRIIFRLFFSRFLLGRLGRDPSFFRFAEREIVSQLLRRARHVSVALCPANNPYLHWILTGRHGRALPHALRPENFETIRANLGRLEWRHESLEAYLDGAPDNSIDRFNLSDVFEYMSNEDYHRVLESLVRCGRPRSRLAYWNLVATRRRPRAMADRLRPLAGLASRLHARDKAFFYGGFVVEEKI
jgi:S-adenosylmethionine-diacylglycerol 3-amino-3-carboxypropyl transferase